MNRSIALIFIWLARAMVINAHGISGSDPGAVPGGSTTRAFNAELF